MNQKQRLFPTYVGLPNLVMRSLLLEIFDVCQDNLPEELEAGYCWIAVSLAQLSDLILCGRIDKHTNELAIELVFEQPGEAGSPKHLRG